MKFFKPSFNQIIESSKVNFVIFGPFLATTGLMWTTINEEHRRKDIERKVHKAHPNARIQWPMGQILGGLFKPNPKIIDATTSTEITGYKP